MIAEIIPLLRIPPGRISFDYSFPENFESRNLSLGAIAIVPWRGAKIFGIIKNIKEKSDLPEGKLQAIKEILGRRHFVPEDLLALWIAMGGIYNMSPGSIAKTTIIPLKKTKLQKIAGRNPKVRLKKKFSCGDFISKHFLKKCSYFNYPSFEEKIEFLNKQIKQDAKTQIAIIEPTINDAEKTKNSIQNAVLYTAELSEKEKFAIWIKARSGEIKIIVGTKTALFLPFARLNKIIVCDEANEHHKNWDQSPKYNAKDIAAIRCGMLGIPLILAGWSPSAETFELIKSGDIKKMKGGKIPNGSRIKIINKAHEFKKGGHGPLSEESLELLQKIKNGSVLILANRKGNARNLKCTDCGFIFSCPQCKIPYRTSTQGGGKLECGRCGEEKMLPIECERCAGVNLKERGIGIEGIKNFLEKFAFSLKIKPEIFVLSAQTDENNILISGKNPLIWIVGTYSSLNKIDWNKIFGVIMPLIDLDLQIPSYKAAESVYCQILRILGETNGKKAPLIIETFIPDNSAILAAKTSSPNLFYEKELEWRKILKWPPYARIVKIEDRFLRFDRKNVKYSLPELYKKLKTLEPTDLDP